jgi:transposase
MTARPIPPVVPGASPSHRGPAGGGRRRAVMVLLSLRGLAPSQIAELLDCRPATVRRWIGRFNAEGLAGLAGLGGPGWAGAS